MALTLFVLVGPGGAGKGTVASELTARVGDLWLSRSWTTRPRRAGEPEDAYVWVTHGEFRARVTQGGFFEWAEYLGNLYGTPVPDPPPGSDVLLEIDLQGAEQVLARCPDAVVVLLLPPSRDAQRARLVARGDSAAHVEARLAKGEEEVALGRRLASFEVVNAEVGRAVETLADIVATTRARRGATVGSRADEPPGPCSEPGSPRAKDVDGS